MSWSNQQSAAIKTVRDWATGRGGSQVMRLFGFAGTGKTTIAKELAGGIDGTVFCAPTGKASLVLRRKGCAGAQTIHSLIYKALEDEVTGEVTFKLNPDSAAAGARLIIVDESSMVDDAVASDLLSYGTKVLALGDPAQLPPVNGEGYFTRVQPDIMLTEVHRQAADNPIIAMSMTVRTGGELEVGDYGTSRVVHRGHIDRDSMREMALGADQLLCGLNKTRQAFNDRIRQIQGRPHQAPVAGDKLICLRNNREKGLLNGGMWTALDVSSRSSSYLMRVRSDDDPDITSPLDVTTPALFFSGREKEMDWKARKRADEFTFGYAVTVHKSQGSQWDNVLVFDESRVFREDSARHLYTAITRAAERITVVVD